MELTERRLGSRAWIFLIPPILLAVFVALDPIGLFGVRRYESKAIIHVRLGPHDTWIPLATEMKSWDVFQPALSLAGNADGLHRYEVFRDKLFVEPTGKERGELFVRYRSPILNEPTEALASILRQYRDFRASQMLGRAEIGRQTLESVAIRTGKRRRLGS